MRPFLPPTLLLVTCLGMVSCNPGDSPTRPDLAEICGGYPDWQASSLVLPYAVGTSRVVSQANCTPFSHKGQLRYGYDFAMPIGTPVEAVHGGTVTYLEEGWPDGDGVLRHGNLVRVDHGDGTWALYLHLTTRGVLVSVGDRVEQGEVIALSGNSGYTLGLAHLHFHLAPCPFYEDCGTIPATFRNTDANPEGLVEGHSYPALPY